MRTTDVALAVSEEKLIAKETPERMDIDSLVTAYYPIIRRLAFSILGDVHEAEDAAQETFIAVARSLEGFREDASPKTWLYSIAVNHCRGRLRKVKTRMRLQNLLQALHLQQARPPDPEQAFAQNEADRSIWQAVDHLDEKHRLVVILRYVHDLTTPEIAQVLGISPGTVHSRLHYARQELRACLGGMEEIDEP